MEIALLNVKTYIQKAVLRFFLLQLDLPIESY